MDVPERKSPTEAQDLQRKIVGTLAGKRPVESSYPYFTADYRTPFVHIGDTRKGSGSGRAWSRTPAWTSHGRRRSAP